MSNEPDIAELASGCRPVEVLLTMMLNNQIDELAMLHHAGLWQVSPAELAVSAYDAVGKSGGGVALRDAALAELRLWGEPTDALLEAILSETPIRLDRGRILDLARKRSARMGMDGRRAMRGQVQRVNKRTSRV